MHRQTSQKSNENDSTSHSSKSSAGCELSRQIYGDVLKQLTKNQQKYAEVIQENPEFSPLFSHNKNFREKLSHMNTETLSQQMDKLLEDQCRLDKQLSKIGFNRQESQELKLVETAYKMDHYSFLRTIWSRKGQMVPSEEKIQSLNQRVGAIKGHIKMMEERQKQSLGETSQLFLSWKDFHELKYEKEQIEKARELENKEWEKLVAELNSKIIDLTIENDRYCSKLDEEVEKRKQWEDQLVKMREKYQAIELDLLRKDRQLRHYQNQERRSNISHDQYRFNVYAIDSTFVLGIKSRHSEVHKDFRTEKTLPEIISFLNDQSKQCNQSSQNPLETLFDLKLGNHNASRQKAGECSGFLTQRRRVTVCGKFDNSMVSHDKKRRFERTCLPELQEMQQP